jgi:hypothetical protein
MKKYLLMSFVAGVMFLVANAGAKEVNLDMGETYRHGDLTVTCGQSLNNTTALALNDCQYWDNFNEKCLFEMTTYTYKNLKCVEECQHWEKFNSTCHYKTKCAFYPTQKSFVQTRCDKYDDFNKVCIKTSDIKIGQ